MKKCSKCGASKPLSQFNRDRTKKCGFKSQCVACVAAHRVLVSKSSAARCALWRANNPEKFKASVDSWRTRNMDARRAHWRNRNARLKAASGTHSAKDIEEIISAQRRKCACCQQKLTASYHVDHMHPISRGGSNSRSNLQILCPSCNCKKHDKTPEEFMRSQGLLL